jgi:beta-lactam-binding protein with PASTA domain
VDDIRAELQEQGFTVEVIGKGDKVVRQMPAAGKLVPQKGIVVLYTEADLKTRKVEVPNLVGMTETQARYWALRSGLNVEVVGDTSSGASLRQNIEPGTTVAIGSTVTVTYISGSNEMNIEDTGNAD